MKQAELIKLIYNTKLSDIHTVHTTAWLYRMWWGAYAATVAMYVFYKQVAFNEHWAAKMLLTNVEAQQSKASKGME